MATAPAALDAPSTFTVYAGPLREVAGFALTGQSLAGTREPWSALWGKRGEPHQLKNLAKIRLSRVLAVRAFDSPIDA